MKSRNTFEYLALKEQTVLGAVVGLGESFFPAIVMLLGCPAKWAALAISLPIAIGCLGQLIFVDKSSKQDALSSRLISLVSSHSVILLSISLVMVSFSFQPSFYLLFIFCSLSTFYAYTSQLANMVWSTWIVDRLALGRCEAFFFRRNSWSYTSILAGMIGGGLLTKMSTLNTALCFGISLGLASGARAYSAYLLHRLANFSGVAAVSPPVSSVIKLGPSLPPKALRSLIPIFAFVFLLTTAVHISAGFYAPYMIGHVGLSYFEYSLLTASAFLARAFSGGFLSRSCERFGARGLMLVGATAIVLTPLTWIYKTEFWFLILSQIYGGLFWAAFELGLTLNLLRDFSSAQRMTALRFSNTASALGILAGTLIGFSVANAFPQMTPEAYTIIFLMSAFGRGLPLLIVPFLVDLKPQAKRFVLTLNSVRPAGFHALRLIVWPSRREAHTTLYESVEPIRERDTLTDKAS